MEDAAKLLDPALREQEVERPQLLQQVTEPLVWRALAQILLGDGALYPEEHRHRFGKPGELAHVIDLLQIEDRWWGVKQREQTETLAALAQLQRHLEGHGCAGAVATQEIGA